MKKLFLTLIVFAQLFNANAQSSSSPIKGEAAPPAKNSLVLNSIIDSKTGERLKMVLQNNKIIDDPEICKALGVQNFTIAKGNYDLERNSKSKGGVSTLTLAKAIDTKGISKISINTGCWFFGENCQDSGLSPCLRSPEDGKYNAVLTPIIENGKCTKIEISFSAAKSTTVSTTEKVKIVDRMFNAERRVN
jgi:hypothetical protein